MIIIASNKGKLFQAVILIMTSLRSVKYYNVHYKPDRAGGTDNKHRPGLYSLRQNPPTHPPTQTKTQTDTHFPLSHHTILYYKMVGISIKIANIKSTVLPHSQEYCKIAHIKPGHQLQSFRG